jgi:hypothetical protein
LSGSSGHSVAAPVCIDFARYVLCMT